MKVVHSLFIITLICLSVADIHGARQPVTVLKQPRLFRHFIEVAIVAPNGHIISSAILDNAHGLYFDFTYGTNEIRVRSVEYLPDIRYLDLLSSRKVDAQDAPPGSKIIIRDGKISIEKP